MPQRDEHGNILIKIVYYGPALSGKTTNIIMLHEQSHAQKGEMMVMETQGDRTLFFDVFPLGIVTPDGTRIKVKLYTVPGQVEHNSTRKAILSRADGICFVADSQRTQTTNNTESMENLLENMRLLGMSLEKTPLVVQFNKRDMDNIIDEQSLLSRWRNTPWPDLIFASAINGDGVMKTFSSILVRIYDLLIDDNFLDISDQMNRDTFVQMLTQGEAA